MLSNNTLKRGEGGREARKKRPINGHGSQLSWLQRWVVCVSSQVQFFWHSFRFFLLCRLLRFVSYFIHIHDIIITLITFFLLSMFFLMNGFGKVSHALPIIPPSHYFLSISLYIRVDMGWVRLANELSLDPNRGNIWYDHNILGIVK